jgi:PAS domain-containing protein
MRAPQSPRARDAIRQGHTDGVPMPRAMGSAAHAAAAVPEPPQAGAALAKAVDDRQLSDAHLRHLLDTLPLLASCHRPDGSNAFCNQRWHAYTGLSPQEAHGWGWTVPIHPDDLGKLRDTILYAALHKTFLEEVLEMVCCSPITGTSWNVWKRRVNNRFNSS